jgi:hypothetical protein
MYKYAEDIADDLHESRDMPLQEARDWVNQNLCMERLAECLVDPTDPQRDTMAWVLQSLMDSDWYWNTWLTHGYADECGVDMEAIIALLRTPPPE